MTARLFQALDENPKYMALFHLDSPAVAGRPESGPALDRIRPGLVSPFSRIYQSSRQG